jgi:hypothetical protein
MEQKLQMEIPFVPFVPFLARAEVEGCLVGFAACGWELEGVSSRFWE